jgi:hypothetical protein
MCILLPAFDKAAIQDLQRSVNIVWGIYCVGAALQHPANLILNSAADAPGTIVGCLGPAAPGMLPLQAQVC